MKNNIYKIISIVLAVVLIMSFVGCSKKEEKKNNFKPNTVPSYTVNDENQIIDTDTGNVVDNKNLKVDENGNIVDTKTGKVVVSKKKVEENKTKAEEKNNDSSKTEDTSSQEVTDTSEVSSTPSSENKPIDSGSTTPTSGGGNTNPTTPTTPTQPNPPTQPSTPTQPTVTPTPGTPNPRSDIEAGTEMGRAIAGGIDTSELKKDEQGRALCTQCGRPMGDGHNGTCYLHYEYTDPVHFQGRHLACHNYD